MTDTCILQKYIECRAYYDAEVIKSLALSEIFPLDASYKVPNWIMQWGGSRMFDVLKSGLYEYGEIVMQYFVSSDNHLWLEIMLPMLKSCGLSPSFASSDVIDRDTHLL